MASKTHFNFPGFSLRGNPTLLVLPWFFFLLVDSEKNVDIG